MPAQAVANWQLIGVFGPTDNWLQTREREITEERSGEKVRSGQTTQIGRR